MHMAADPNMTFGVFPQAFCNQRVLSFQTGAVDGGAGVTIPGCFESSNGIIGTLGTMNDVSNMTLPNNSPNLVIDQNQSLKYGGTDLSADWSYEEVAILKEGLEKYAAEPNNILKYIKIAAGLSDKTVRGVALRCQWMIKNARRRKAEKIKDRKDKMVDPSFSAVNKYGLIETKPSIPVRNANRSDQMLFGAAEIDAVMRSLEENARLLHQIRVNQSAYQTRNNLELFNKTRSNIQDLLIRMSQMPGIMSKMPPLPASVDEQLATYLLRAHSHSMDPLQGNVHLIEEPRGGW